MSHVSRGFTLIEVLVAIFLVTMGAGGAFSLIHQTTRFTTTVNSQLEASYLAQEGVEIVRNIRDTNFLKDHKGTETAWTEGLTGCEVGCGVDYQQVKLWPGQADKFLNVRTDNGFYGYASGVQSPYKRKITITQPSADKLEVSVEVTWSSNKVEAATELYNWLPSTD